MDISGDDMAQAVQTGKSAADIIGDSIKWVGMTIASVWGVVTIHKNQTSKGDVKPIPADDLEHIRTTMQNMMGWRTKDQVDFAELHKDIEHILSKIDEMERKREKDHEAIKKLNLILYPLLKDTIAQERKKMGLDTDTDEMPAVG